MTEAGSSSSSLSATFGKQDTGDLAPFTLPRRPRPLRNRPPVPPTSKATEEISELLRNSLGWNTIVDRRNAETRYFHISRGEEYADLNIEDELKKLKGLLSALANKYDIYKKKCEEVDLEYKAVVPQLVEELVKKVPNIKLIPGYQHLTSTTEKIEIEKALRKMVPEVKLQDEDALAELLKNLRTQLLPMETKLEEVYGQLGNIYQLRRVVDKFVQILTAKQSRVVSDVKEKKHKTPAKNVEELRVRKEVKDGLLKVRNEVGGPRLKRSTIHDGQVNNRWDSIVDDLTNLLTEASAAAFSEFVLGDKKRKRHASPTKNMKSGEVENGLLEMLKEIGGSTLKSFVVNNDEFMMKLVNIGDAFTRFLDYYFC